MKVVLVVGCFPQVSESFIFRKAVALAQRGIDVTVMARRKGNWDEFRDQLPVPSRLRIEYLCPDYGWRSPRQIASVIRTLLIGLRTPRRTNSLLRLCKRQGPGERFQFRTFI